MKSKIEYTVKLSVRSRPCQSESMRAPTSSPQVNNKNVLQLKRSEAVRMKYTKVARLAAFSALRSDSNAINNELICAIQCDPVASSSSCSAQSNAPPPLISKLFPQISSA